MNINKYNYEEFFLMYVDKELCATEKIEVELFIAENPDLATELSLLQEATLLPEPTITLDKSFLYKNVETAINTNNYSEKFVLYIDDELTISEKKDVETFVLQHPEKQAEFTLLKQTKLPLETVVCPNKNELYREERSNKIIFLNWQRIAVAAVFIALAIGLYSVNLSTPSSVRDVVTNSTKTVIIPSEKIIKKNTSNSVTNNNTNSYNNQQIVNKVEKVNKIELVNKAYKSMPIAVTQNTTLPLKNNNATVSANTNNIEKTSITYNQLPIKDSSSLVSLQTPNKLNASSSIVAKNDISKAVSNTEQQENIIQPAVYKQLDTEDDKKILLIGSIEINKDKLRGFLRKASRLLNTKEKKDNNTIAIASFAINKN